MSFSYGLTNPCSFLNIDTTPPVQQPEFLFAVGPKIYVSNDLVNWNSVFTLSNDGNRIAGFYDGTKYRLFGDSSGSTSTGTIANITYSNNSWSKTESTYTGTVLSNSQVWYGSMYYPFSNSNVSPSFYVNTYSSVNNGNIINLGTGTQNPSASGISVSNRRGLAINTDNGNCACIGSNKLYLNTTGPISSGWSSKQTAPGATENTYKYFENLIYADGKYVATTIGYYNNASSNTCYVKTYNNALSSQLGSISFSPYQYSTTSGNGGPKVMYDKLNGYYLYVILIRDRYNAYSTNIGWSSNGTSWTKKSLSGNKTAITNARVISTSLGIRFISGRSISTIDYLSSSTPTISTINVGTNGTYSGSCLIEKVIPQPIVS